MASGTALNTLNIFQYNQLGDDNSVINQGIDLDAECKSNLLRKLISVERISTTTYESDYEFQNDLSVTIRSLNDGHYAWNSCYDNAFVAVHYLPIVSLLDGESTSIFLAPNLPMYAERDGLLESYARIGYNLTQLAGAKVISITWILSLAWKVGRIKIQNRGSITSLRVIQLWLVDLLFSRDSSLRLPHLIRMISPLLSNWMGRRSISRSLGLGSTLGRDLGHSPRERLCESTSYLIEVG
jgi:hypothetical protein